MQQPSPIPTQQLPQCQICKLDPVPQSSQHILLLILQIGLIFLNWKFSIILLMLGYCFPRTNWKCPYCTREIDVDKNNTPVDSLFIRMGKCMALFSLTKFRFVAGLVIAWMLYLFAMEPKADPKKSVTKTWESMVLKCGFQVYMENSVRSNRIYNAYLDSGYDWDIEAIYLNREPTGIEDFENVYFKMNPTQFKDPEAYDFKAFTRKAVGMWFTKGDIIRLKGEWQGRQYHNFIFNPVEIIATGKKADPSTVSYIYDSNSMLRSHLDAVKDEYETTDNPKDTAPTSETDKKQKIEVTKSQTEMIVDVEEDHIREEVDSVKVDGKAEGKVGN